MTVSYITPRLIQRLRSEILVAMKHRDWAGVKSLDSRLSILVEKSMASAGADLPSLSRELTINLQLYRQIVQLTGSV